MLFVPRFSVSSNDPSKNEQNRPFLRFFLRIKGGIG
jgi:hypothetical protein